MQIFGKNLMADLSRMQGIISISEVTTKNLIYTQMPEHTLDYMHVKAELNDLVEQMH